MQIQIQLTQDEVEDILKAHIQENLGIDLRNRAVTITFSGTRSDRKVGAEITVEMDSLVPLKPAVTEPETEAVEPVPVAEVFKQATEEAKEVVPSKGKLQVPEEPGDALAEEEDAPFEPDEPEPKPIKRKGSLFGD